METKKYQLFDGDDTRYETVVTSDQNIRQVCRIAMACADKSDEEIVYYAGVGDIAPDDYDKEGNGLYHRRMIYSQGNWLAALVPVLFYDGPEIIKAEDGEVKVVDKKLKDTYIRSEVRRAFDDFLSAFGVNPYEVKRLFDSLSSDLTPMTIQRIMNPDSVPGGIPDESDTKMTSKAGETSSGKDTPTGRKSSE